VEFHVLPKPTDADIERLVRSLCGRSVRLLHRRGALCDEGDEEPGALALCQAASAQGRIPFGPGAGARERRVGRRVAVAAARTKARLCADYGGYSLHAAVRVPAGQRNRLERLCRYLLRPAIVVGRLSVTPSGQVRYAFKKEWRDGSMAVEMSPLTLLSRLAALVPAPWVNLVTYHGLLAPAASYRDRVVPEPEEDPGTATARQPVPAKLPPELQRERKRRRLLWAEAMKRGLGLDVLVCEHCGGRREVLALITNPRVIDRILSHLGLPTEAPAIRPARAPPGSEELFDR